MQRKFLIFFCALTLNTHAVVIIDINDCKKNPFEETQFQLKSAEKGSLKGKENFSPESTAFNYFKNQISSDIKMPSDLPQINVQELTELQDLNSAGGLGNSGISTAIYQGKKVILKKGPRELVRESKWFMIMNKMNMGPEFHGITILSDGTPAIVTEFIEGSPFSYNSDLSKLHALGITPESARKMASDIQQTGNLLFRAGIHYAPDMQFMLTKEGRAIVIDPEYFEFTPPLIRKINSEGDPRANAKITADRLLKYAQQAKTNTSIDPHSSSPAGSLIILP